jgi:pyruvyltransferase
MSVPLYWWKIQPNFGDRLAPILVQYFSGNKVVFSKQSGKLVSLGSVLHFAKDGDHLWGTGMRQPCLLPNSLYIHAVRGPKTRSFLLKNGFDCPEIYGDPAILMPQFYRPEISIKHKITVLPHYSDYRLKMLAQREGFPLLSVFDPPLNIIDRILATQILVTSSLHGLILAEAYGVTCILLRDREQKWEPHFKFIDYFLSTGREDQTLWNISIKEAIQHIPKIACPIPIDTKKLITAFPKYFCDKFSDHDSI